MTVAVIAHIRSTRDGKVNVLIVIVTFPGYPAFQKGVS
jgi:hypothetical protein